MISQLAKIIQSIISSVVGSILGGVPSEEKAKQSLAEFETKMSEINDELADYRDAALKNNNFMGAYLAESQRIGFKEVGMQARAGTGKVSIDNVDFDEVGNRIFLQLNNLKKDPAVKENLKDYRNHDSSAINEQSRLLSAYISEKMGDKFGETKGPLINMSNNLFRASKENMTLRPETPAEQAGINSNYKKEMDVKKEVVIERKNEVSSGPTLH